MQMVNYPTSALDAAAAAAADNTGQEMAGAAMVSEGAAAAATTADTGQEVAGAVVSEDAAPADTAQQPAPPAGALTEAALPGMDSPACCLWTGELLAVNRLQQPYFTGKKLSLTLLTHCEHALWCAKQKSKHPSTGSTQWPLTFSIVLANACDAAGISGLLVGQSWFFVQCPLPAGRTLTPLRS